MENKNEKWIYDYDDGDPNWSSLGCFDSKEEAVEHGKVFALREGLNSFRIGQRFDIDLPGVDVDSILENISENICSEVGKATAGDYLSNISEHEKSDLEEKLNEVLFKWLKENDYEPNYYLIENEETYEC